MEQYRGILNHIFIAQGADEIIQEGTSFFSVGGFSYHKLEAMTKCKEWAHEQGYLLFSGLTVDKQGSCEIISAELEVEGCECCGAEAPLNWYILDTEFEAVLRCCQWIKENK